MVYAAEDTTASSYVALKVRWWYGLWGLVENSLQCCTDAVAQVQLQGTEGERAIIIIISCTSARAVHVSVPHVKACASARSTSHGDLPMRLGTASSEEAHHSPLRAT